MDLSEKLNAIKVLMQQVEIEITSLEAGRKASAPRARKHLQAIKSQCHLLRKDVTIFVSNLPTKKKETKDIDAVAVKKESEVVGSDGLPSIGEKKQEVQGSIPK